MPSIHDHTKDESLRRLVPQAVLNAVYSGPRETAPFVFLKLSSTSNERFPDGLVGFDRTLFQLQRIDEVEASVENLQLDIPNLGHTDASKRFGEEEFLMLDEVLRILFLIVALLVSLFVAGTSTQCQIKKRQKPANLSKPPLRSNKYSLMI